MAGNMAAKKTKPATKTSEGAAQAAVLPAAGSGKAANAGSGAAAAPQHAPDQLRLYEAGIRLFHSGNYREAREQFGKATRGSDRGIAHRAELHARMCDRRLEQPAALPKTAEEHYNYGVALINARELAAAREHLQAALAMESAADHIFYALALCYGLSGDLQACYENLKRAIELQPRNRIAARQDADFAPFANQPPLDKLLHPEKENTY
jgi:tetratricopeptide (TPR) repeat protein